MGEYHGFYLKSYTLLVDGLENFIKMFLGMYELDPAKFLSATGLAWKAAVKKAEVKLELLTDTDILIMVEKWIRGRLCYFINRYAEANNKYMKNDDKNKGSSYNKYWDIKYLYGWTMWQNFLVNGFKWVEDLSEFNEDFIKGYDEKSKEVYFF